MDETGTEKNLQNRMYTILLREARKWERSDDLSPSHSVKGSCGDGGYFLAEGCDVFSSLTFRFNIKIG